MAYFGSGLIDMVSAARHTETFASDLSLSANRYAAGIILCCMDCGLGKLRCGSS